MSSATKGQFSYTKSSLITGATLASGNGEVFIFHDGTAQRTATISAAASPGTDYFVRGDDDTTSGSADLLKAIKDAIDGAPSSPYTATVTMATSGANVGKVTISVTGGTPASFELQFGDASTTFDATKIGFTQANTGTGASHTGANHSAGVWFPEEIGLLVDNNTRRRQLRNISAADVVHVVELNTHSRQQVSFEYIDRTKVKTTYAATNADFETAWASMAQGNEFVYFSDLDDLTAFGIWVVDEGEWAGELHVAATPLAQGGERYNIRVPMRTYVSG